MKSSARPFLDQLIDYAGLFPPAKLSLEDALRIYLHERKTSAHRWMLGRFVCPTARLQELSTLARSHEDASFLSVTALGRPAPDLSEFFANLETDLMAIESFRRGWGTDSVVDTIEVPLPKGGDVDAFVYWLGYAAKHMVQAKLRGFLEIARSAQWHDDTKKIAQGLGSLYDTWDQGLLGLKLRCGGLSAEAFPTNEQVAFFIARCNDAKIPWKATAGLHHPRRHWDQALQLWHYGFLNVFGAGVLAWSNALTEADLVEILSDRDAQHFQFEPDRFAWKDWSCTAAQVILARSAFAKSFGSCSFEEPCQDLVALGLLPTFG
ncbi:MAG: hypothetical protein EXR98_22790 [Gemmataceae bacterium]|nr:hypothetical protein [Gemmataceae bacterium]